MSKPRSKAEWQWLIELRELAVSHHKPATKRWVKRMLNKAWRRQDRA